jgi:hypothetical protein
MLMSMVAMPNADLIVAGLWVGGLTLFLLGQAFAGWLKFRYARRSARHASRLFEATRAVSERPARADPSDLLPRGTEPASTGSKATALATR